MIDVGGAALLGAAARNAAGVAAVASPEHYPQILAELQERGARQPRVPGPAGRRGVRDRRGLPRRDRGLPQPARRARPSRSAWRWSSRRSPTCATARTRTSRRPSTARRPIAPGRSPTRASSRAARRRSTTCSTSTPPTGSPRDYTTPTVVIAKHTDPVGLASADELVEAYRRALETDPVASFGAIVGVNRELDGADGARDRRELVRGGHRARASTTRRSGSCARRRASSSSPSRPTRPRACATTASPARLQARRRRAPRRDARRARPRPQPAPGRDQAPARRSRS